VTPEDLDRRLAAIEAAQLAAVRATRITAIASVALVAWTIYQAIRERSSVALIFEGDARR
jgi:hypothetical protein